MRLLKLIASLVGVFAILTGNSACKKDNECCTYTYQGATTSVCEDDAYWRQYYDTWSEFVDYAESYGAVCD
jgi:cyclic lactone autoinducer peptide